VLGRTLPGMNTTSELASWAQRLEQAAIGMTEASLRESGMLHPPIVHVLAEGLDPPYVGYLTCRPFYRGSDARTAIGALGVLPALLGASHVVVVWENADLCTALELDEPDGFPAGVVVVMADQCQHTLCWHPMRMRIEQAPGGGGGVSVISKWGPVQRLPGGDLPDPVAELLAIWRRPRTWSELDQLTAYTALERGGYQMRWVQRDTTGPQPGWVQLFSPLMD
jgi:hypothetical protein